VIKLKNLLSESLLDDRGKDWLKRHNAQYDNKGRVIAYHGTFKRLAKLIQRQGFKQGSYFSLEKEYSQHWGEFVFEVHLPLDSVDFISSDLVALRPIDFQETI
jgi:hypothetical protein